MRRNMGTALADRLTEKVDIDVVVPIPDTSRPAAAALAERRAPHSARDSSRIDTVAERLLCPTKFHGRRHFKLKLNPLPSEPKDKRVVLVDDSIVRGTTLKRGCPDGSKCRRDRSPPAIHAPPVSHPCFYGIDMSTKEELFAARFEGGLAELEPEASEALGVDSLTYLEVDKLNEVFGGKSRCGACLMETTLKMCRKVHVKPSSRTVQPLNAVLASS